MGRLGQDPELRYTPNQIPVASFSLATSEYRISKDGQKTEQTEWHRIVAWSKQAELAHKYLAKGRPVFIEGKIQTRNWEDKTGQKRQSTEIIVTNLQFIGPSPSAGAPNQEQTSYGQSFSNQEAGFSFPRGNTEPAPAAAPTMDDMFDINQMPF